MPKTILALEPSPTFAGDVKIAVPGALEPASLELVFNYKNNDEYNDWLQRVRTAGEAWEADRNTETLDAICGLMLEVVAGWNLPDAFNVVNLATLLRNYPMSGPAIIREYGDNLAQGRRKN